MNRIFSPPLLDLLDLELAIAQLEDVIDRGARVVHLRPAPVDGRSPADPYYDPWWARVAEAGVVVAFHISECGYNELVSQAWGEKPNPPVRQMSAWQWTCSYGDRPIMDTMAALVLHNLFGRFPTLKVASIEHGFTHFRLRIHPLRVEVHALDPQAAGPGHIWLPLAEAIGAAIPVPVRRILRAS